MTSARRTPVSATPTRETPTRVTSARTTSVGGIGLARVGAAFGALVGVVALAAAGGAHRPSVSAVDTSFVADMAPHHALGVRMAALALRKADDVRVREFGFTMARYQQAEFDQLTARAQRWRATPSEHIHGMLTDAEEQQLASAEGAAFDRAWLQQMIRHHQGAVMMATDETASGSDPETKTIAAFIVLTQTKEIGQMQETLRDLGG